MSLQLIWHLPPDFCIILHCGYGASKAIPHGVKIDENPQEIQRIFIIRPPIHSVANEKILLPQERLALVFWSEGGQCQLMDDWSHCMHLLGFFSCMYSNVSSSNFLYYVLPQERLALVFWDEGGQRRLMVWDRRMMKTSILNLWEIALEASYPKCKTMQKSGGKLIMRKLCCHKRG